jgi:flagellar basal-body rod protein FlgG
MSDPALRIAATGMKAQEIRTQVIANNLANANTVAFKRSRPQFEDLLYQTVQDQAVIGGPETQTIPAIQVGRGVRLAAVQRVHDQGSLEQTGRPLDLAIEGEGFFQVQMPGGELAYTRAGNFAISDQGALVTPGGYPLVPSIHVPVDATGVTISRTGIVSAVRGGGAEGEEIGRIELARFANAAGLRALGENLYGQTAASGEPVEGLAVEDGFGSIQQGALEAANVEMVQEMVDMITAMRAYESCSKAIKTAEQMGEVAASMVR